MVGGLFIVRGGRLSNGTFHGTEAEKAEALAATITGHPAEATFVVVFASKRSDETFDDVRAAARNAVAPIVNDARVANVTLADDMPPALRMRMENQKEKTTVAYVTLGGTFPQALKAYPDVRARIASNDATVTATGRLPFIHDLNHTLEKDLLRAEVVALPLALLVLAFVFRSFVAAALPVVMGALAVVPGIGFVLALSHVTEVSSYSVNVCSLIGLGVSIDYSLFLVSRYREELAGGASTDEAIVKALKTAGRVIGFSGIAVSAGLGGLLFFGHSYLFAMGIAAIIVVVIAVTIALTAVPAALSLLGRRIDALPFPGIRPAALAQHGSPMWAAIARAVMKRPLLFGVPTLAFLVLLGIFRSRTSISRRRTSRCSVARWKRAKATTISGRFFPILRTTACSSPSRFRMDPSSRHRASTRSSICPNAFGAIPHVVGVDSLFSADESLGKDELEVYLPHPPPDLAPAIEAGKARTVGDHVVTLYALTDGSADAQTSRAIVRAIRENRTVGDGELYVGGQTADEVDALSFIKARVPHAIAFVVLASLFLMFVLLRSIVLPIKAVIMNCLSITGAFGAIVWVFQDGHFGVEARPLDPALPLLLFCVIFGLSMDYEVLLLSRVREAFNERHGNRESVAIGVRRTAGLITSAAAIMIAVFAAFAFARVIPVRAMGVGMAIAIFIDATLVRTILVPATMRLLGRLNWWLPKWARSLGKRRSPSNPAPGDGLTATGH